MIKIGKIGKRNIAANKELKKNFEEAGITVCEVTGKNWALTFAHRHKRIEYRSCPEKLSDLNEVLLLTVEIHNLIEHDRKLTNDLFNCLRPVGKPDGFINARRLIVNYLEKQGKNHLVDSIL